MNVKDVANELRSISGRPGPKRLRNLVGQKELCLLFGIGADFLKAHTHPKGSLPCYRFAKNGKRFYDAIEVEEWLEKHRQSAY